MIGQRNSHSVVNRATFLILGGLRIFFRLIGHRAANFLQSGSVMPAGGFPALPKIAAPRLDRRAAYGVRRSASFGATLVCATLINVLRRNVTFHLPVDLLRQAKVYAAEHDTTVNAMVRQLLEEKVTAEARTRAAAERFLQLSSRGPYSSVDPGSVRREELYERR
jgi:plasmid stability protein